MGQHLKVGILPNVPGSTASLRGLVDGIWGDMLTRELDFMDDVRYYPLKSWFTSDPTTAGLTSWEDGATTYRAWRDEYFKESNEYMLGRGQKQPYIYRRFARDPKPWANDWNGSNPIDWVRITYPNKDGEFCMPLPTFYGSENYIYQNPAYPIRHDYMRMRLRNLEDLSFAKSYQSGDPMYHLEEQGMVLDQAAIAAKSAEISEISSLLAQVEGYTNVDSSFTFDFPQQASNGNGNGSITKVIKLDNGKYLIAGSGIREFNGTSVEQNRASDGVPFGVSLIRLNSDFSVDETFNYSMVPFAEIFSMDVDSSGKILIAGNNVSGDGEWANSSTTEYPDMIRLNEDGSVDSSFAAVALSFSGDYGANTGMAFTVKSYSGGTASADKILLAGYFDGINGTASSKSIAMLNSDGSIDAAFAAVIGSGITGDNDWGFVRSFAIQPDGKIVLVGEFGYDQNGPVPYSILRLNSDGSTDTTFATGTGLYHVGSGWTGAADSNAVDVQADGKILVGGNFDQFNGSACSQLLRLNSDGTLDEAFIAKEFAMWNSYPEVCWAKQLSSGKILVTGHFSTYDGVACNSIVRINSDGTLDTTFRPGSIPSIDGTTKGLMAYGEAAYTRFNQTIVGNTAIVIGSFTQYAGSPVNGIVAISLEDCTLPTYESVSSSLETANSELNYLNGHYIPADTMDARLTNYRARRDAYIKLANEVALGHVPTEQEATQLVEDREFLEAFDFDANVPSMWSDEICRPVWSGEISTWEGSYFHDTTLTNHEPGTMPFEVLPGVTSLNMLPSVPNMNLLPATGNPGDVLCIQGDGDLMAWDPQNQEWSYGFFNRFLEFFFGSGMRATRDAKLKARNEMALALRPFNFASFYVPSFPITDDSGNIKSELL